MIEQTLKNQKHYLKIQRVKPVEAVMDPFIGWFDYTHVCCWDRFFALWMKTPFYFLDFDYFGVRVHVI